MPGPTTASGVDESAIEDVARAYLRAARGDAVAALGAVVRDALAEGERRHRGLTEQIRFSSRGYVRGQFDA